MLMNLATRNLFHKNKVTAKRYKAVLDNKVKTAEEISWKEMKTSAGRDCSCETQEDKWKK